jgi:glycerophosphoryl diester phosphodiesterase
MAVITFAHRGARAERPENTLPAFRRALEQGARGLETDAWLAADGEVVLVHDERIRRGLRRIRVTEATAAELAEVDVPRLADLYAECGTDFELSVDCKQREAARPMIEAARAAGNGAPGRLWLCAASRKFLAELRDEAPDVKLVYSPGRNRVAPAAMERHAADLAAQGVDCLNLHHSEWTRGLVALFHRFGLSAFAWDTQETRYILAMLRMDIDGVYCDRVDRMVATVGEWSDATTDASGAE